ncbi:dibenzothiophene desulfurase [Aquicoccus sp. SCR17]|nr:dibenzothiophene desulfurase [Carideicomes alvinocaridis]
MHPAPSVIVFTALSGLGFGLLAWLGLGLPAVYGWAAFWWYFVGYALAVGGLMASVLHLGNPKNGLKAFSQWRTSWLSREGVAAVVTLLIIAPFAIGRIFLDTDWGWLGAIGSLLCLVTVFCTSMIYAQLRTVPRWNNALTPVLFLAWSVAGGALLAGQAVAAGLLLLLAGGVQVAYWLRGDQRFAEAGSTIGTATGLGALGRVRLFEPPHQGTNYLLKEMGFSVARKHAVKLRVIALAAGSLMPAVICILMPAGYVAILIAFPIHLVGIFAARWLFFAEADHVMKLYYGG